MLLFVNIIFALFSPITDGAWVEIPQVPNTPADFIFGAPKNHSHEKTPLKSPTHFETKTAPILEQTNYKQLMTSLAVSTTVATLEPQIDSRIDLPIETTPTTPEEELNLNIASEGANEIKPEATNYPVFLSLLNNIQQTLTLNTKKNIKSKISVLINLRDTLLANIDDRMSNLWKRSADVPEARGHDHEMDFPSNEGALMTIGFLTFAVFLIKLVLKLIHALKYKQNSQMMMPMTTSATLAFSGRKRRNVEDYDSLQILQMINDYTFT